MKKAEIELESSDRKSCRIKVDHKESNTQKDKKLSGQRRGRDFVTKENDKNAKTKKIILIIWLCMIQ